MSLRNKFLISFLALALFGAVVAGLGLIIISSLNTMFNDIMDEDVPTLVALGDLKAVGIGLVESARSIPELGLSARASVLEEFSGREQEFLDLMTQLEELSTIESAQLEGLHEAAYDLEYAVAFYVPILLRDNPDPAQLQAAEDQLEVAEGSFITLTDSLLFDMSNDLPNEIDAVNGATNNLFTFGIVAGILLVVGAISLGIYLANTTVRPLNQLTVAADRLGQGDLDMQVKVNSQDEIGQLAQSFNQMALELRQTTFSRDYVENIFQSMGSALIVADEIGRIATTNAFAQQLLGYSGDELQGRNVSTLFDELDTLKLNVVTARTSMCTRNGSLVPVAVSRRIVGPDNMVVYNAQDLTQLERMQKQLIAAQSEIEAQGKRAKRLYTLMDLMLKQLNNVFEHGASREELRGYMDTLNVEFTRLSEAITGRD